MKPEKDPLATTALNLPVFDTPQQAHWPRKMTWEAVTDETAPQREYYMKHFDSPEKRLRRKNPVPFRMHWPEERKCQKSGFGTKRLEG